jgi:hypothetical protein
MQLSSMQGESLRVDEPKAPLSIKLKTLGLSVSPRSAAPRLCCAILQQGLF